MSIRPFVATLAVACSLLLSLVGCASTGVTTGSSGTRGTFALVSPQSAGTLRIVSDSWIASQGYEGETVEDLRVAFASDKTRNYSAKICPDDVFDGIVEALGQTGFDQYAQNGRSPVGGVGGRSTVELTVDGEARHLFFRRGVPDEHAAAYAKALEIFRELFNRLDTYQAVEGRVEFQEGPVRR